MLYVENGVCRCTCSSGENYLFFILPDGSVLREEDISDDFDFSPPSRIRIVTVPAEIVQFLQG